MNFTKIIFKPKKEEYPNSDFAGLFISEYLWHLYENGQIEYGHVLVKKDKLYWAFVTAIDSDSLEKRIDSEQVKLHLEPIRKIVMIDEQG